MIGILRKVFKRSFTPLNLIYISKDRLIENYRELSSVNSEIKIAPVLKSNAYGHGIRLAGKILDGVGAPFLCVDSLYEAFQLYSKSNVDTPILIMGYIDPKSLQVKKLPFSFAIYDFEHGRVLNEYQKGAKVHIFVDTGMNREGVRMEGFADFLEKLKELKNIEVEGLMSHLADPAHADTTLTKMQLSNFQKARELVAAAGLKPKWFHIGGSYGLLNKLAAGCNLVRVGRAVYGIDNMDSKLNLKLKPALKHTSKIVQIKRIKKGDTVGYNGSFKAKKDMVIGILPLGYNDGVDRRLSDKGVVTVGGVKCPIIGLVSMNITTIDITAVKEPVLGQIAVVYSDNAKDENSVVNMSKAGGVLPHEMLIHIAESTKRVVV